MASMPEDGLLLHGGIAEEEEEEPPCVGKQVPVPASQMLLAGGEKGDAHSTYFQETCKNRGYKVPLICGLGACLVVVLLGIGVKRQNSMVTSNDDEYLDPEYLDQMPTLPTYAPPVLPSRSHEFRVDAFGAVENGRTVNTAAFQQAMAAAAAVSGQGGATVLVPAGRWLTGPFALASNVTLLLATGAIILATTKHEDYKFMSEYPSYCPPGAAQMFQPFISGVNLTSIAITGNGTIDGRGAPWWSWHSRNPELPRPPRLIELEGCDGIIISGISLKDSPYWTVHPIYSRNIRMHGLTIRAAKTSNNTDGIDPDSCENVLIENCTIATGDDSVAIKSGRDEQGMAVARPSRFITVRGCVIGPATHGISIGSELSGGVSDVTVHDIVILGGLYGIRVKTIAGRGGQVKRLQYWRIWARKVKHGFMITTRYNETGHNLHPCGNGYDPSKKTTIEDVKMTNYTCLGCKYGVEFGGFEDQPLSVQLQNISLIDCQKPWKCKSVKGTAKGASPEPCSALQEKEGRRRSV